MISALLVQSRGAFNASSLMYQINNGQDAMAVNPATVMREFFSNFLEPGTEILVAQDGEEVVSHLVDLNPERAGRIGEAARRRVCAEHTYARRARQLRNLLGMRTVA